MAGLFAHRSQRTRAVAAEVGAADPLPVGVEDGRDELLAGELALRPFQQRSGQLGHVGRLDVAGHAEPEPAVPLQVGLDIAEVAGGHAPRPSRRTCGRPRSGRIGPADRPGSWDRTLGRPMSGRDSPSLMDDLVPDAAPGLDVGPEDRLALWVVDRQGERPVREVLAGAGQDALGQRQGLLGRDRTVDLDAQLALALDADGRLTDHAVRLLAEELGEAAVLLGVVGELRVLLPSPRDDILWRRRPAQGAAVGVAGGHGAVSGVRVLQPPSTTAAMQHIQASDRVVRRFTAASIGRPALERGTAPGITQFALPD